MDSSESFIILNGHLKLASISKIGYYFLCQLTENGVNIWRSGWHISLHALPPDLHLPKIFSIQ